MTEINKRDITRKYLFSFITIAMVFGVEFYLRQKELKDQEKYAYLVNISGRQRMLSQQSLLFAIQYLEFQDKTALIYLNKNIETFKKSHLILVNDNNAFENSLGREQIESIYFSKENSLNLRVKEFLSALKVITLEGISDEEKWQQLKLLKKNNLSFLKDLNTAVYQIEKNSFEELKRLEFIEYILLIILILIFVAQYYFYFRPMAQGVETAFKRVEDKEKYLKKANESLRLEKKVREGFLSNISHEMRTPINAIVGVSYELEEKLADKKYQHTLDLIRTCVRSITSLFEDALELNVLNQKEILLDEKPFNLKLEMNNLMKAFDEEASNKGLEFQLFFDEDISTFVFGDQRRIGQVFIYLISNAIKFTDSGEIKIEVVRNKKDLNLIDFSIRDSGRGISKDNLHYIFDEHWQETSKHKSSRGGLGIGLTMANRLVVAMGGEIFVESNKDQGTKFSFSLPLRKVHSEENAQNPSSFIKETKILLVEDNLLNQKVAKAYLKKLDLDCDTANNGKEALDKCELNAYDIILLDIKMPVMDGIECTKEIIKRYGEKRPYIIAQTANALSQDKIQYLELGINDVISKPIDFEDFKISLEKYLKKES